MRNRLKAIPKGNEDTVQKKKQPITMKFGPTSSRSANSRIGRNGHIGFNETRHAI